MDMGLTHGYLWRKRPSYLPLRREIMEYCMFAVWGIVMMLTILTTWLIIKK